MRTRKPLSVMLLLTLFTCNNFAYADTTYGNSKRQHNKSNYVADTSAKNELLSITTPTPPPTERKNNVPSPEEYLLEGKITYGEQELQSELKRHDRDDELRFALGIAQFLRAVERFAQDLHRYGFRDLSGELHGPVTRWPIASNPKPEKLTYVKARKIAETFLGNLSEAEATLSLIKDANVKLPLHFGMIRLDMNGDGQLGEGETLWEQYALLSGNKAVGSEKGKKFSIAFDRGDAHWLRGYTHVMMSLCEIYLAHDSQEMFEDTAHLLFSHVESRYGFLKRGKRVHSIGADDLDALDVVAFIHLFRWEVIEPQRMAAALHHLEQVVVQSREMWKCIATETDDDHEWIPNSEQTGVLPNVRVTAEMIKSWGEIMNQVDKILKGELLIPFWRGDDGRGVNLRKVFLEPRTLDLVLWVQGSAAAPYLQMGEKTKGDTWRRLSQEFGRHFPGFALYFN